MFGLPGLRIAQLHRGTIGSCILFRILEQGVEGGQEEMADATPGWHALVDVRLVQAGGAGVLSGCVRWIGTVRGSVTNWRRRAEKDGARGLRTPGGA